MHRDDRTTVAALLKAGVDPDRPLRLGKASANEGLLRPLWLAAVCGHVELAKLLLKHGAEVEGGNRWQTPLLHAMASGHDDVAAVLRKHGAKAHLLVQVAAGNLAAVKKALQKDKALALLRDETGMTPLHYAARKLNAAMAKLLLAFGAEVDARTEHEESPLYVACDVRAAEPKAQRKVLETLRKAGAKLDGANFRRVTPLHVAVRARSVAAVEFLLRHGAQVDAEDSGRGSTPLRRAVTNTGAGGTKGRTDEALRIALLLLKHGADPRKKDARGRTILASARGQAMRALVGGAG
ncbi:MAG: ankyrin repeat domain-containing protein [Planctomycetota bacterium]|nr:ankyrin repeat domain-containing protein [Planctomycetota bacterium]